MRQAQPHRRAEFQTRGLFRYPVAYGARDVPQTKSLICLLRGNSRHPPPNRGRQMAALPPARAGRTSAIRIDRIGRWDVEWCQ